MIDGKIGSLRYRLKTLSPKIIVGATVLLTAILVTVVLIQPRTVYTLFFWHNVKFTGNNTVSFYLPQIVRTGNNVYVVWEGHGTNGYNDISFKVSKNGGTSFRNTINLSYRPSFLGPPQIAAAGNNVYVVWEGHGIMGTITYIWKKAQISAQIFRVNKL